MLFISAMTSVTCHHSIFLFLSHYLLALGSYFSDLQVGFSPMCGCLPGRQAWGHFYPSPGTFPILLPPAPATRRLLSDSLAGLLLRSSKACWQRLNITQEKCFRAENRVSWFLLFSQNKRLSALQVADDFSGPTTTNISSFAWQCFTNTSIAPNSETPSARTKL